MLYFVNLWLGLKDKYKCVIKNYVDGFYNNFFEFVKLWEIGDKS